ncbi:alanyl-tRNA editing protein [Fodinicola feengrottensis]|uniref:hypothetical protein n=1 Tax=Fodinicola feengrottensis TaxID=435914 RepID=UPI00244244E2|nr:hypothetical protein [Fodinicola feengrottensis]
MSHTHRLDLEDASLREWDATVLQSDAETGIVLDRSAFYPGGGGQPPDHGTLLWGGVQTRIAGTRKGESSTCCQSRATRCRRWVRPCAEPWRTSAAAC